MSKYTLSSILFGIVIFAMLITVQYEGTSSWILLPPIIAYLVLLAAGSFIVGFNFYFKSLCKVKTTEKIIALTFDDGPHPTQTLKLIEVLDRHQASATFFCIGSKVERHPDLVAAIDKGGHLLGNHSFSHHRYFDLQSSKKMATEILKTNDAIHKVIGRKPLLFRPPYGVTNPPLKTAVQSTDMISIGWSLRTFDTMKNSKQVLEKLYKRTKPGKVVLFHDTTEGIYEMVDTYLGWLKTNGYKVVSLEHLFNIQAYEIA